MKFVFDSDMLSLLERGGAEALFIQLRLGGVAAHQIYTTIITYEEHMRGWLSIAAQAKNVDR
jgi:tRNA(fMet)-specific endonuclease VapC